MSQFTIYHNPRCSKSRQTLALLNDAGIEPEIVLYLDDTPNAKAIKDLLKKLGITARELLRKGEADYKDNHLKNPELSDDELVDFMVKFPKLIERPIVVKGKTAVLGRPPENVEQLL